ncbi:lanthionine synthetase LanC family protein [Lentzea sp. NBRC 102530]|uniref:class III lanthionine synthetase LanKC N-terminal domain-containing protein n=1 Tax=Lentzea sp. NBRC 102530 TaxID=3032201 RepID=UPI0024A3AA9E|nr:lanthionine synthetase LanC family protein [Lentzea sp. NBRC 102530]GLY47556.1 serine/threonine protein kinase [Lentzea sp. NBRC 102530]
MRRRVAPDPIRREAGRLAARCADTYTVRAEPYWWHFDPVADVPARRQGWKIHVSAAPADAAEVLRRVAAVVTPLSLRWKAARSVDKLMNLSAPPSPLTQSGKFITIYPSPSSDVEPLCAALDAVTSEFDAPVVPSDRRFRPHSNVYLRYGAFVGQSVFDPVSQSLTYVLVDPSGRRVEDRRAPGVAAPDWIDDVVPPVPRPFLERPGSGLFGREIVVQGVLRQSVKGGVFRVLHRGVPAVLKEARIGTTPDRLGRDSRTALLNEWKLLRVLSGSGLAPEPLAFFHQEDNAYLVQEFLPGRTLRASVERANYRSEASLGSLTELVSGVRGLVAAVEALGVRLLDLTPNNVMVDGSRFYVIDLEHAALVDSAEPPFVAHTPGYVPADAPWAGDTEYALAAIAHFVLTGIDPHLGSGVDYAAHLPAVVAAFAPDGVDAESIHLRPLRGVREAPTPIVAGRSDSFGGAEVGMGVEGGGRERPAGSAVVGVGPANDGVGGADSAVKGVGPAVGGVGGAGSAVVGAGPALGDVSGADSTVEEAVEAGEELVRLTEWDRHPWPWPQRWAPGAMHPASFMAGTAGIARFYLDLHEATGDGAWLGHADQLLTWTVDTNPVVPGQTPPGLYFGLGALPWLMTDLAAAGHEPESWRREAVRFARELDAVEVAGWDVTHGWAGVGLAKVAVLKATGEGAGDVTKVIAKVLGGVSTKDGLPAWPTNGSAFHGFAHGSAGVAYFLLHAGLAVDDPVAVDLAVATGRALLGKAQEAAQGISWPHKAGSDTMWSHWCNGAAGVGILLQALAQHTEDPEFADGAVRAGRAITTARPFGSTCRCHGLAGDGDFLLDLAREHEEFHAGAVHIGRKLDALRFRDGFAVKWAPEGLGVPRPDYMRGYTGVHAFRLRLAGHVARSPLTLRVEERP